MILPASGGPAAGGRATLMPGTRDLARHQFVSENTVQDHLNSIFTKTATRNRRSLLARALGT